MLLRTKMLLGAVLLTVAIVPTARAGWVQYVNRSTGLWWSDGYHAYTTCPDHHRAPRQPCPPGYYPGLMSPLEYLPAPAPSPAVMPIPIPDGSRREMPPTNRFAPAPSPLMR